VEKKCFVFTGVYKFVVVLDVDKSTELLSLGVEWSDGGMGIIESSPTICSPP